MPKRYGQACPVAKSLEVIGDRWTLLLVRDLLPGPKRFRDFGQGLKGIAPNILSDRLKRMEDHGLVARRFYSDHPPRAEYLLTERGLGDRKSTRLNSSHSQISYAVFCLKKKNTMILTLVSCIAAL